MISVSNVRFFQHLPSLLFFQRSHLRHATHQQVHHAIPRTNIKIQQRSIVDMSEAFTRPTRSLSGRVAVVTGAGAVGDGIGNGRGKSR